MRVLQDLGDIPAQAWNRLVQPEQYFRHDYLMSLTRSRLDCEYRFAIAETKDGVQAFAFGYLMRFPLLPGVRVKVFIGGSPVNIGLPFACDPCLPAPQVLEQLTQTLLAEARHQGALFFVVRDFAEGKTPTIDAAAARLGLVSMPLHACAWLNSAWADFDTYLAALRGANRKAIRRDLRTVEDAGFVLKVQRGTELDFDPAEIQPLWEAIYRRHDDRDQVYLPPDYFRAMAELPHAVFFLLQRDDRPVAFDLCFALGSVLESVHCGLDYGVGNNLPIHRYMSHRITGYAIEQGFSQVNFGISNEATKQRTGCRLEMQHAYVRAVPPWLNQLGASRLVTRLYGARQVPTISAFREDAAAPTELPTITTAGPAKLPIVVIGAGLSGLAAAAALAQRGVTTLLVERQPILGGACGTRNVDGAGDHIVGCNLFPHGFFEALDRHLGIRLPYVPAPVLTFYRDAALPSDASPRTLWRELRRLGVRPYHLMVAGARLSSTLLRRSHWAAASFDDITHHALRHPVLRDLAGQMANLYGVPPGLLPASVFYALFRHAGGGVYPTSGIPSIAAALRRAAERSGNATVLTGTAVERIVVIGNKVHGVYMGERFIAARAVVSTLPYPVTLALADQPVVAAPLTGLATAAILLRLSSEAPLPRGFHTTSFITPDVAGQLTALAAGYLPEEPSFDLVAPDGLALQARRRRGDLAATIYLNWPRGLDDRAALEVVWKGIAARLDARLPGFAACVRGWHMLTPTDYPDVVGFYSVPCPVVGVSAPVDDAYRLAGFDGLHNVGASVVLGGSDALSSLLSGLRCADALAGTMAAYRDAA
jgi:phytoene dehydrogenase-like protein/predicted N-acyltransferase